MTKVKISVSGFNNKIEETQEKNQGTTGKWDNRNYPT